MGIRHRNADCLENPQLTNRRMEMFRVWNIELMGKKENPDRFIKRARIEVIDAIYSGHDLPKDVAEEVATLKSQISIKEDEQHLGEISEEVCDEIYKEYKRFVTSSIQKAVLLKMEKLPLPIPETSNFVLDELLMKKITKEIGIIYRLETGPDGSVLIVLGGKKAQ